MTAERTFSALSLASAPKTAGSRFLGFGAAQPEQKVHAQQLGAPFGRSAEWINTRTGIDTVRRVQHDEQTLDLAVVAAHSALKNAGLGSDQIDLVIIASCSIESHTSEQIAFAAAPRAAAMAMNAACSGFCYAISTADALIRDGAARNVLVVAAEQMSRLIDPTDLGTSIIFGDGAGAAVLGPASAGDVGIGPVVWGSDGGQSDLIACSPDGHLRMAGQQVFRWAVEIVPDLAIAACERAGVAIDDIDVFVPHQANMRIIEAVTRKIGLHRAVVASDISRSGNTSAASIPIALSRLIEQDQVKRGQLALLVGFGAGLAYAAQVVALP